MLDWASGLTLHCFATDLKSAMSITIPLSPEELEALIRRVVREELAGLMGAPPSSILDDWMHEGPDDPAQDALLLREALEMLGRYRDQPQMSLAEFRQELARAEASDELPD